MALDFSEFAVVYHAVMVALPTDATPLDGVEFHVEPFVVVGNVGHADEHVRGVVRSASGAILADSANLTEAPPFELVHPNHFQEWSPDGLPLGGLSFHVYATAATLIPTVDLRVHQFNPDGTRVRTSSGACYPGDFAITYQRIPILGGVVVPIGPAR